MLVAGLGYESQNMLSVMLRKFLPELGRAQSLLYMTCHEEVAKLPLKQEGKSWILNGKSFAIFLSCQSAIHDPIADDSTIACGATAILLRKTLSVVKMRYS